MSELGIICALLSLGFQYGYQNDGPKYAATNAMAGFLFFLAAIAFGLTGAFR